MSDRSPRSRASSDGKRGSAEKERRSGAASERKRRDSRSRSRSRSSSRGRGRTSESTPAAAAAGAAGATSTGGGEERKERRSKERSERRAKRASRSRSRSRSRSSSRSRDSRSARARKSSRSRSPKSRKGESSGSSSSSSDSEDEAAKRRRRKKEKKAKKSKKSKKGKDKKKKSKDKKEKPTKSLGLNAQWGKYGTVGEDDGMKFTAEFHAWLFEVKNMSRETMTKKDEKNYWGMFREDFNTATMPSEKYYNMEKWMSSEAAKIDKEKSLAHLSDEQRLLLERNESKAEESKRREAERVRLLARKLQEVRDGNQSEYEKIKSNLQKDIYAAAPTFESIAKARKREAELREQQAKDKKYGGPW